MTKTEQPPFFPFWAKDWISSESTRLMSLAARGAYVDLLTISWLASDEPCSIPDDDAAIAKLLGVSLREWKSVASTVRKQFERTENGRLRNARLYAVYCEVAAKRERQSQGGKSTASKRWHHAPPDDSDSSAHSLAISSPTEVATAKLIASKARTKDREKTTTSAADASGREVRSARPSTTGPRKASWLEPSCTSWEAKFGAGSFPWGEAGKALKPLHAAGNTADEIGGRLREYLEQVDARFVSLARFAKTYDSYTFRLKGPALDEGGWMTPEFDRLTRAPAYVA